jgi:putative membrane protein insertion efficiency factor
VQCSDLALDAVHPTRRTAHFLQAAIIGALRVYKLVFSPLFPSACRFYPTCSEYMRDAVQEYGAAKGIWMGLRRLSRCHPFHEGGYDPVR